MRVIRLPIVGVVAAILVGTSTGSAGAQARHVVDPSALAQVVTEHTHATTADRTVVRDILKHPDVTAVAAAAGVDLARLSSAVETLSPADLARAADAARGAEAQLAMSNLSNLSNRGLVGGASTITISTTTIIIGLLVLILIIVAVD